MVTGDNLWWLGNNFPVWHLEMTSGKRMWGSFQRLQQLLEVAVAVGSCGNCWKLRWLLEAVTGCRRGPQYDRKCSFYFNCYFFCTTPTNQNLRQKAVYFSARPQSPISPETPHWALMSPHWVSISSHVMASVREFHDVSQVLYDVLRVFHECFAMFYKCRTSASRCLTMFSESRNNLHCRIGDRTTINHCRNLRWHHRDQR